MSDLVIVCIKVEGSSRDWRCLVLGSDYFSWLYRVEGVFRGVRMNLLYDVGAHLRDGLCRS